MGIAIFIAAYILFPGAVAFVARSKVKSGVAFTLGCCVAPAFVLLLEIAFPFVGGAHSMLMAALLFGSMVGALASGLGVALGRRVFGNRNVSAGA